MLLDIHAHVIPGRLGEGSRLGGPHIEQSEDEENRVLVTGSTRFPTRSIWFSVEKRLEQMDAHGVDVEAISPMPALFDPTLSGDQWDYLAAEVSEAIRTMCEVAPDRMVGLGMVPMDDPDKACKGLARIRDLSLRGVEVPSNLSGAYLTVPRYEEFFREAERLDLSVFVHGLGPTMARDMPREAVASFGVGAEMTTVASGLIMGGLADKCPDLRLCFSHGAGGVAAILPRAHYFWAGAWNEGPADPAALENRGVGPESPFDRARSFFYDTLVFDRRVLRLLLDVLGHRGLLVGTDFPAMARERPAGATIREMGLDGDVLEAITWRNAWRFLGVEL